MQEKKRILWTSPHQITEEEKNAFRGFDFTVSEKFVDLDKSSMRNLMREFDIIAIKSNFSNKTTFLSCN